VGFLVRLVPEVLAFPNPVGFDTVYYALFIKNGVVWGSWASVFTSSWLLYAFIVPAYSVVGGDPFAVLKVAAPVLFGLNVAGVYWFARKMLGWSVLLSMVAGGFFAFQLGALRISWDLLRNTLGMSLLLFTLPLVKTVDSRRGFFGFVVLSLLTVFAHEYAAVALLVIVLCGVLWRVLKGRFERFWQRLTLAIVPALIVFVTGLFLRVLPLGAAGTSRLIDAGDSVSGRVGGLFFLVDYLQVRSAVDSYATYGSLVFSVLVLFGVLYLSYFVLVLKGYFRSEILDVWTGLLLVGAVGCLVLPFFALEYWHRWMFMLAYPFTFYAINGLRRTGIVSGLRTVGKRFRPYRLVYRLMVLVTVVLGIVYLMTPVLMTRFDSSLPSVTMTSAYFSVSPTVPYEDVDSVVAVMGWLDTNMSEGSCVLLQHAFLSWGQIYLDETRAIVHFEVDPEKAVGVAVQHHFDRILFVWWNVEIGWYGIRVPDNFVQVHSVGRLSVYEYVVLTE
jgi:hypothetical protein